MADFESLETLVLNLHESVITEMREGFASVRAGLKTEIAELRAEMHRGFAKVDSRLTEQGGMILSGTGAYQALVIEIANLKDQVEAQEIRLRKLEGKAA